MSAGQYLGNNLNLAWIHAGGTTTLSGNYTKVEQNETANRVECSGGSDTYQVFLIGKTGGELTMTAWHPNIGNAGSAIWAAVKPATEGTIILGPEGTTTTYPKHTIWATVSDRKRTIGPEAAAEYTVTWAFKAEPSITAY